jgi:ABC-type antimicrobial peptide transport system permease subunit
MTAIRDDATSVSRAGSSALSLCAAVALLLTSVGLYGLVAMWATRRRGEIAIRLALGATKSNVHALLLSAAGRLVGVGAAIGLVCAFGLVRIEQGWLGPIVSLGPGAVLGTLASFAFIAGAAAMIPTWRATRRPPAEVLRALL